MNPQQKAQQLIEKYKPYVYCFMGSDMLVNQESESVILSNAKKCALMAVDEIIEAIETTTGHCELRHLDAAEVKSDIAYWERVQQEIKKLWTYLK